MPRRRVVVLLVLLAMPAPNARAQTDLDTAFEVRYGLFHIADVTLAAHQDPSAYRVTGVVTSAGLVRYVRDFHFDLSVEGGHDGVVFRPAHYVGDMDTGRRQVQVEMLYPQDTPEILRIAPEEPTGPWTIAAADQTGAVDPLTALYRVIRPRLRDELCGWAVDLFDGRRRSRLTLDPAQPRGDTITCVGAYQRVAGYAPAELADYTALPFALVFQPDTGDEWHLTRMVTQTPYGRMRIVRTH